MVLFMNKIINKVLVVICVALLTFSLASCKGEMVGSLTEITMSDMEQRMDNDETFIVLFSQTSCSFCKAYKENLKDFMEDNPLHVLFIEIDKEENQEAFDAFLAEKLTELEYLPATVYIKDGEIEDFCEGELIPEQIEIWLYRNGIKFD